MCPGQPAGALPSLHTLSTKMADQEQEAPIKVAIDLKLVYTGVVLLVGDKLGHAYSELTDIGTLRHFGYYTKRLVGYERIGQVVAVKATENKESVFKAGRKVTAEVFWDAGLVLSWDAKSRATQAEYDAEKESRKNAKHEPATAALQSLREAYQRSNSAARGQLLARFVHFITKPE